MSHTMRRLGAVCFTMFIVACTTAGCEGEDSQDTTEGQATLTIACATAGCEGEDSQDTTEGQAMLALRFRSRWDQVGGNWSTGWVYNHPQQVCGHADNCACDGFNNCGTWGPGTTVFYWPEGCGGPRWAIKCSSEPY